MPDERIYSNIHGELGLDPSRSPPAVLKAARGLRGFAQPLRFGLLPGARAIPVVAKSVEEAPRQDSHDPGEQDRQRIGFHHLGSGTGRLRMRHAYFAAGAAGAGAGAAAAAG